MENEEFVSEDGERIGPHCRVNRAATPSRWVFYYRLNKKSVTFESCMCTGGDESYCRDGKHYGPAARNRTESELLLKVKV